MNVKYVVGAGCSFFRTGYWEENKNRKHHETNYGDDEPMFLQVLGEKLGARTYWHGLAGTSIQHAIRVVFEWCLENQEKVKNTFFMVGLTEAIRTTFYSKKVSGKLDGFTTLYEFESICAPKKIPKTFTYGQKRHWEDECKRHNIPLDMYKNWAQLNTNQLNNPEMRYRTHKMHIIMLENYIESLGGTVRFLNTVNIHPGDPLPKGETGEDYTFTKNLFKFPNGLYSWRHYIWTQDNDYRWGHPSPFDHKHLGNILYEYINKGFTFDNINI